jgi:hypothetical protein
VNGAEIDEREEVLRQSIEHNEAELRDAVDEMTTAVKSELTLRGHIAEHPVPWLLGGIVLGLWLSRRG